MTANTGSLIRDAAEQLGSAGHELILDFSGIERIDAAALLELEELAAKARQNLVKIAIRGVNVDVYKALKLMAIAGQFSFLP
jgi:anti-anti-sigma regulatory factor